MEAGCDEISGFCRVVQPVPLSRGRVKVKKRLPHRRRVAEKGPAAIIVAVAKAATRQTAALIHPIRRTLGHRKRSWITRYIKKGNQSADRPAVFARIKIFVDSRHPKPAARGVIERIEHMPVGFTVEIGVLADVKRTIRSRQEIRQIALNVARRGEVFRLPPKCVSLAILTQILRLKRHDLFKMWMGPTAAFRILKHPSPH